MESQQRVRRIVESVAVGAIVALAALFALGDVPTRAQWFAAGFFTLFGVVSTALAYPTSKGTAGNVSFLPFLSVAILAPNAAAVVSVVVSMVLGEAIQKRQLIKLVFNTSQQAFTVALSIAAYRAVGGQPMLDGPPGWPAFVVLVASYFVINKLAVSTVVAAATGGSTFRHWLQSMRGSVVYDALALPIIALLAWLYAQQGPLWTALAALPILGIRQLYRAVFALEKVNEELLQLMVASIEARDPYTSGHSQRVARYARVIAAQSGVGGRAADRTVVAALLHDVGKIYEEYAPILRKPGKLTAEEFLVMKTHPIKSAELVAKVSHFADVVPAVRAHHEAWDGTGYPDQLSGDQIPLAARVIALADTIDAMSTSRPYRAAMSPELVREEIRAQAGRQFDPRICAALLQSSAWKELEREIEIANREHPLFQPSRLEGRTAEYSVRA